MLCCCYSATTSCSATKQLFGLFVFLLGWSGMYVGWIHTSNGDTTGGRGMLFNSYYEHWSSPLASSSLSPSSSLLSREEERKEDAPAPLVLEQEATMIRRTASSASSSATTRETMTHEAAAAAALPTETTTTTANGGKTNRKKRLVIAGTAKDCEKWLEPLKRSIIKMLEETAEHWELHRLVIYENNSKDKTVQTIVERWNETNTTMTTTDSSSSSPLAGKVELISEVWGRRHPAGDKFTTRFPSEVSPGYIRITSTKARYLPNKGRTVRLAYARNRLLARLRELYKEGEDENDAPSFDYLLMMDLDEINVLLRGVQYCFTDLPAGWGGCCANQFDLYYDLWTLRTKDEYNHTIVLPHPARSDSNGSNDTYLDFSEWLRCETMVPGDCYYQNEPLAPELRLSPAYIHIPATTPPIAVHTCFGGATVYDFRYLLDESTKYSGIYTNTQQRRYPPTWQGREACEHVPFHDSLHDLHDNNNGNNNFTMYIQPKMINAGPIYDKRRFPGFFQHRKRQFWEASKSRAAAQRYYPRPEEFAKTRKSFKGIQGPGSEMFL